jgi:hypothetical protein
LYRGDLRDGQHVTLRKACARNAATVAGLQRTRPFRFGDAALGRFVADIHHPRSAGRVEMGKLRLSFRGKTPGQYDSFAPRGEKCRTEVPELRELVRIFRTRYGNRIMPLRPRKKYTVFDLQQLKGKRCLTHIHVKSPEEAAAAEEAGVDLMSCSFDTPEAQARLPKLVAAAPNSFLQRPRPTGSLAGGSDPRCLPALEIGASSVYCSASPVHHRGDGARTAFPSLGISAWSRVMSPGPTTAPSDAPSKKRASFTGG